MTNILLHPWESYNEHEPTWEMPQNIKDKALLDVYGMEPAFDLAKFEEL